MLCFGIFSIAAQSQELKWYNDVSEASSLSIKTKKPLLLFFTGSDWCGWCMRLQKEVMQTPEFTKWATDNVILVELDYPRRKQLPENITQQNAQLQQMFAVNGYPTVWLVQPTDKDNKINLAQLGKTGYVAGGPTEWLKGANEILKNKK